MYIAWSCMFSCCLNSLLPLLRCICFYLKIPPTTMFCCWFELTPDNNQTKAREYVVWKQNNGHYFILALLKPLHGLLVLLFLCIFIFWIFFIFWSSLEGGGAGTQLMSVNTTNGDRFFGSIGYLLLFVIDVRFTFDLDSLHWNILQL